MRTIKTIEFRMKYANVLCIRLESFAFTLNEIISGLSSYLLVYQLAMEFQLFDDVDQNIQVDQHMCAGFGAFLQIMHRVSSNER